MVDKTFGKKKIKNKNKKLKQLINNIDQLKK